MHRLAWPSDSDPVQLRFAFAPACLHLQDLEKVRIQLCHRDCHANRNPSGWRTERTQGARLTTDDSDTISKPLTTQAPTSVFSIATSRLLIPSYAPYCAMRIVQYGRYPYDDAGDTSRACVCMSASVAAWYDRVERSDKQPCFSCTTFRRPVGICLVLKWRTRI